MSNIWSSSAEEQHPRVLFLGMPGNFSYPPLRTLIEGGCEICAVVVPIPEGLLQHLPAIHRREPPKVRAGLPLLITNIVQFAWERQIPVWEVSRLSDPQTISLLAEYQVDVICVACFSQRIPREILDLPRLGCLNVHPSLLPANRGPVPLFWTFRKGEGQTGVTIHLMDEGMDSGDILAQEGIEVPDGISYAQLEFQCAVLGGKLLTRAVWDLSRGCAVRLPQDEAKSSYHAFPTTEDFLVPAEWNARRVSNFMHGLADWGEPLKFQSGEGNE